MLGSLTVFLSMLTLTAPISAQSSAAVRAELEKAYKENGDAFVHSDVGAVMALRAPDFHTIDASGKIRDRAAMEQYFVGFINGVRKWNEQTFAIDSLEVRGDTAIATA